jgi:hypothetical protein
VCGGGSVGRIVIYKEAKEFGFRYTRKREICQKARRRSKV